MDDATYAEVMGKLSELRAEQQAIRAQQAELLAELRSLAAGLIVQNQVMEAVLEHTQREYARDVQLAQTAPRHPWA
jgi:hypothetical protein